MSRGSDVRVLAIGPLPPPTHGVATAMRAVQAMSGRRGVAVRILDIADRRGIGNIGRLDLTNVVLALRHGLEFLWLLARHRPRVVYVNLSQGTLGYLRDCLFLVPARLTGRRVVAHLHGGYFRDFYEESPRWMRALIRFSLGRVERALVLGERFRSIFDGLLPPERVAVVPNGIDPAPFDADARGPDGAPTMVYLGGVTADKGVVDAVRALAAVRESVPDARLVLAGEATGPERREIERVARELGVADAVELPGVVTGDAKTRLLTGADVFVFPTRYRYEGHPYAILEAMAAGLPVVTTDQGCITETVLDGENGAVVPHGDIAALAAALVRLLADPAERARIGGANRARVRAEYSLERWEERVAGALAAAGGAR